MPTLEAPAPNCLAMEGMSGKTMLKFKVSMSITKYTVHSVPCETLGIGSSEPL
eukprot:CAMPEP_0177406474 /NCGR_PEP_ID=MMETSP0368-20130122/62579_1 /TAXON_ID=447022 ORGANISM="Scrippsiella hangoei-like, Strain SHHI-4" /NCGR_SAMPLE_ID=MMETSP0368 /ASSEMBLY_ACC=CAM_ASM_000363 /LENGTH=52 /DNA_ID=CAMNT_0018874877 /DNA_START=109 /DNA_END=267 /DNA_ORIENTATION=-